ncbi:3356_t:CDS:1, partial [Dentiscutata erythropus]
MWSLSGISILISIIGLINCIKIGLSHPSHVKNNEVETTDVIDNDFTNFTSSGVSGEFVAYVENRSDNSINERNVNKSFESIVVRENNFNDETRDDI